MVNQEVFLIAILKNFASLEKRNSTESFLFRNYNFLHKCQYRCFEATSELLGDVHIKLNFKCPTGIHIQVKINLTFFLVWDDNNGLGHYRLRIKI